MSDEDNAGWSLTESDPSVFTALLHGLGVQGLQVEDLWSMDDDALAELGDIKAFIFLFKYVGDIEESSRAGTLDPDFPGYFAQQVITNACATLALLNSVFNLPASSSAPAPADGSAFALGPELDGLREFGLGMDAQTLGLTISNSDKIREVHNSFARADPFALDPAAQSSEKEDAYHFVAYLPVAGQLYELDGLQPAARSHGAVPDGPPEGKAWLAKARDVIQQRIASYPAGALHFSLLGLTADPLPALEAQLVQAKEAGDEMAAAHALGRLEDERQKRTRWAFENSLRRHNHISLAHALLLALAKAGKLEGAVGAAEEVGRARRAKADERRAMAGVGAGEGMEE